MTKTKWKFVDSTLSAVALCLAGLVSVGCTADQQASGRQKPRMQAISGSSKVLAPGSLSRRLQAGRPMERSRTDVTPMQVTVPVRFEGATTRQVEYRFVFHDNQGSPIEPVMDWEWEVLPAKSRVFFRGEAPTDEAGNWKLYVRSYQERESRGRPGSGQGGA